MGATTLGRTLQGVNVRSGLMVLLGGFVAAAVALAAYADVSGPRRFAETGDAYPGMATSIAEPVGYFSAAILGSLCLGTLLYVVMGACPDSRGVIDTGCFHVHLVAERVAVAWTVVAFVMVPVQAANDSGVSVAALVGSPAFFDVLSASQTAQAWFVIALVCTIVAAALRLSVRWVSHVVLAALVAVAVIAVPVTGNASTGPDHDYATSAVIVFWVAISTLVGVHAAALLGRPDSVVRRRLRFVGAASGIVALGYGVLALAVLLGPSGLTGSDYGRLAMAAGAGLLAVTIIDMWLWRRSTTRWRSVASASAAVLVFAVVALVSAMATQTAPRLLAHEFTVWDVFLGYQLDGPPTVLRLAAMWRFDIFIGAGAVALAIAYTVGYLKLRRRGDHWPAGRVVAWLAGCVALVIVTGSGLRSYGSAMFSVHMADHMTLNMFIPVLLVLGAPITLALRVLPAAGHDQRPGPREWLVGLVHSRATAVLSHPVVAFTLFVASLYAVYFTSIFDTLVRYHWGHELMSVHFLLTGYLFFWVIIGVDPGPRRLPFLARLGLLFAVMPFHAFFGIATMTMTSVLGGDFYRSLDLPWVPNLGDDQNVGGAIAWGSSELPILIVVVALVTQWARDDRRAATRQDRHAVRTDADDELDAYNAMVRQLARGRH